MAGGRETRLYLVRHGETNWNREHRLQGVLDVPLNEAGAAQARRLADRFAALPISCVVSSPLVRASATAATLAEACACPLQLEPRLREVDHGSWSGLTLPEIGHRFPSLVHDQQLRPEAFDVSGGERLLDVHRRVSAVLADLLPAHDGNSVLVVGHGVTLAVMWCAASGADAATFNDYLPANGGSVLLTFSNRRLVSVRRMTVLEQPA
jgi:broad specificity phosphatase PhoE